MDKHSGQMLMENKKSNMPFLKDVFICLLSAFGGPETHFSVMMDHLVMKKKYLSETELIEMVSLCNMLPGPTSTQLIISIGHKLGGPKLALPAMLIWALPSLIIMSALSFLYVFLNRANLSDDALQFIAPMAVGFIFIAAMRMGKTVITSRMTAILFILSGLSTYFIRTPWSLPLALLLGGVVTILLSREKGLWHKVSLRPPWAYLIVFLTIGIVSFLIASSVENRIVDLFDSFYRFGYLVFGGGQVAVPLMYGDLVDINHYMTGQEFMAGYGLSQGIPGPMFSFSGYAGGLASRGEGIGFQVLGAATAGFAIFLPGILLIFFVYPIWESLKTIKGIRISLLGINAVAGGMVAGMAFLLLQMNGFSPLNITVTALAAILVLWGKIPTPIIVSATLAAGILLPIIN
jgi:chromate transporter